MRYTDMPYKLGFINMNLFNDYYFLFGTSKRSKEAHWFQITIEILCFFKIRIH